MRTPETRGGGKARPRFTEATIQKWYAFFEKYPEPPRFHTLSTVADIASSLGVSTEDILRLLLDGQLSEVCRDKGKDGLAALLIRKDGAARHFRGFLGKEPSKRISTVSGDLRISTTFLLQLARAGHFAPVEVRNDRTNQPVTRLSDEEVALFNSRYVSRRSLSHNGRSAVALKRKLDAMGILPEFSSADTKEFVYLRTDLEAASLSTGSGDQDLCH